MQRAEVSLAEWLDALAMGEEVDGAAQQEATRLCSIHNSRRDGSGARYFSRASKKASSRTTMRCRMTTRSTANCACCTWH